MSAISLKSITGITSITTPAGVDNVFTVHSNDTTERFRVDSTGNLNIAGISTFGGNIQNSVHVRHNSGYGLRVERGGKFLDLNGDWAASGSTALNAGASGIRFYYGSSSDGIQFNTGSGDDKVRITSDGKVGIGSESPQAKLDVRVNSTSAGGIIQIAQEGTGDAAIDFQLVGTREYVLGIDNSDSDKFKLSGSAGLGSNDLLTVTSGGLVGIGTITPNAVLHVEKSGTNQVLARFESNMGTNNNRALSLTSPTSDSSSLPFTFLTGNSISFKCDAHVVHIDTEGRLGIGTDATDTLLHLQGDKPKLRIESTNVLEASAGTEEIGRIEFEAKKGNNINVAASLRVRQDGTWSTVDDWFSPTAIEFYTQDQSGTEITKPRLTINNAGKVGIGTAIPTYILHTFNHGAVGSAENSRKYDGRFTTYTPNRLNLDIYDRRWEDTQTHGWVGTEKRIEYNVDDNTSKRMWMSFFNPNSTTANNVIRFGEREDTEWMRIYDGKVGIGTDNPGTLLHLSSNAPAIRLTDTDTAGPLHVDIESASGDLYLDTGSVHRDVIITSVGKTNEVARFTGDGLVGIGSNNPGALLHLQATDSRLRLTKSNAGTDLKHWDLGAQGEILRLQAKNDAGSGGGNLFDFYRSTNQITEFRGMRAGSYWFVINNSSKKVGIGTAIPQDELHIEDASPAIRLTDSANGQYAFIDGNSGNLVLHSDKGNSGSSSTIKFGVDNSVKMTLDHNGHLDLATGNLQFANGAGLDFSNVPASSGNTLSSDGNKLDDYEEGYYNPTLNPGNGSVTSTTSVTLRYVKVGRLVHLVGRLHFGTSQSDLSTFTISLPFANASTNKHDTSVCTHVIRGNGGDPVQGIRILRIGPGGTVMYMNDHEGGQYGNLGTTSPHININFSYFAA